MFQRYFLNFLLISFCGFVEKWNGVPMNHFGKGRNLLIRGTVVTYRHFRQISEISEVSGEPLFGAYP